MTSAELDAAIRWEAEQHVPFPLSDVQLHYEPLNTAAMVREAWTSCSWPRGARASRRSRP